MSWIEIRKIGYCAQWSWSCGVCHLRNDIPWLYADSFRDAWGAAEDHITLHNMIGKRLEWVPVD